MCCTLICKLSRKLKSHKRLLRLEQNWSEGNIWCKYYGLLHQRNLKLSTSRRQLLPTLPKNIFIMFTEWIYLQNCTVITWLAREFQQLVQLIEQTFWSKAMVQVQYQSDEVSKTGNCSCTFLWLASKLKSKKTAPLWLEHLSGRNFHNFQTGNIFKPVWVKQR